MHCSKIISFDKSVDTFAKQQLANKSKKTVVIEPTAPSRISVNQLIQSNSNSNSNSSGTENSGNTKDQQTNKTLDNNSLGMGFGSLYGLGNMYGLGMGGLYPPNSPLYFVQNINYSIMALGQMAEMLRLSGTALGLTIIQLLKSYKELLIMLKQHKYFIWLQGKCKKSKVLRFTVIMLSMYFSSKIMSLLQKYITHSCQHNPCSTTQGLKSILDSMGLLPPTSSMNPYTHR